MKRIAICALALISLQQTRAAEWTRAGWYRLEIFPRLAILSAPFSSEKTCRKTMPAVEDDVVRCVRLNKAGDEIDRAIEFFGAEIKANPRNSTAMNYRGILFAKKGDTKAALAEYANSIKTNPDDHWGFILRGQLYQKNGKRELAIADYREALARNPGDERTVKMVKDALRELGVEA